MAKKDDIAIPPPATLAVPSFMGDMAGQGMERIASSDLEIPRIKLLQALSPELETHNETKQGQFWHTIAEVVMGSTLKFVPVYVDQSFILWRPRNQGGGILARAQDGIHWSPDHGEFAVELPGKRAVTWKIAKTVAASGLAEWGTMDPSDPNSPPAATRMYNIVGIFPDCAPELSPTVITLQRSAITVARKFLGKLKISQAPSFGQLYTMEAVKDTNAQSQEYWSYKFTMAGFVESEERFNQYKAVYEGFKRMGLQIKDIEGLQPDEDAAPAGEHAKF